MRLLQLYYFQEVARSENISLSAKKLHISQPALSKSIKELENELHTSLFHRDGRSIHLNQSGRFFQTTVDEILNKLDTAVSHLHQLADESAQSFTLRFSKSSPFIPDLVRYLRTYLPTIQIKLIQSGLDRSNGPAPYDFEFTTHPVGQHINHLVMREEIVLLASQTSSLALYDTVAPSQLANLPLIMTTSSPLRQVIEDYFDVHGVLVQPHFETDDRLTLIQLIAEDIGIGFLPIHTWQSYQGSHLKMIHIGPNPLYREVYVSYHRSIASRKYHKDVLEAIQAFFKNE